MRVAFVSNYLSPHQRPLSDAFYELTGGRYALVESEEMDADRKRLGWKEQSDAPYIVKSSSASARRWIVEADAVIVGSAPEFLVRDRVLAGKLVFRYSERPLKNGLEPMKYVPRLVRWRRRNPSRASVYLLAASAFAPLDYGRFGLFKGRSYKWGYFPKIGEDATPMGAFGRSARFAGGKDAGLDADAGSDVGAGLASRRSVNHAMAGRVEQSANDLPVSRDPSVLLWCGRFLQWKHPEMAVDVARRLRDAGEDFRLDIVGIGEMEEELRSAVCELGLQERVRFLGALSSGEVQRHMRQSGVFLCTSDRHEGWGAVVNEAMGNGCAVVASDMAGSVPFLVENGRNGVVFHSGDSEALFQEVHALLGDSYAQGCLGDAARKTIFELWNAEIAAERLLCLAETILGGDSSPDLYAAGPCSRAEVMGEDWFTR